MGIRPGITAYLEAALKGSSLRGKVIANNLANLQTPGYRRRIVEFERLLAEAMDSPSGGGLAGFEPQISQPMTSPVDASGNDVVLETEVGEMIKNSTNYKVYLRILAKIYQQMEMAIQDR